MGHPGKQSFIARADLIPIVAGHVGIPIEIAFDAPGFVINLAPLFAGVDFHLEAAEIEFAGAYFGFTRYGVGDAEDGAGLIENLLSFLIEVVDFDAFEQNFVFTLGDVVNVKHILRALISRHGEQACFHGRGDVEKFFFARGKIAQNAGLDRDGRNTIGDALEVDLNGLDWFGLFLFFFFSGFLLRRFRGFRFLVVLLLVLGFVGGFFLIAFGLKGRSFVRLQRDRENAVGGIVVEALIQLADAWIEIARGNEIEIFSVVVKNGIVVAIEA